jgi:putative DNA primase/helicase
MNDDVKIVGFPKPEVSPEELIRRQRKEAERLAGLSPGEWQLWIDKSAAQLDMPRATLEASVKAIIAEQEKKAREAKRENDRADKAAMRKRQEKHKQKTREFKVLAELPERDQEARLDALAKRLEEDPAAVREEFALSASSPEPESVELWPEAVEAAALLAELTQQLRRFIIFRHDTDATAVALWIMFAWVHAVAVHSPILVAASPEPYSGKSTLLGVLARLTSRPVSGVELTGPALYRRVDRDHPTLLIDEADDLFVRKLDLRHIINAGWTRGTKVSRVIQGVVREFDPFCPKVIAAKGMTMPDTTASRCIIVEFWPKLDDEKVESFGYADSPEHQNLRRKLMRWGADNATTLAEAKPTLPAGFNNRLAANWRLLFAIADHAGGDWPKRAREAATGLSRQPTEPSAGIKLLEALRALRAARAVNRESVTSAAIVQALIADPDSEWREYKGRSPITQRQIAALLRNYRIYPRTIHPTARSDDSPRGYRWEDFDDAFARFLRSDPHIRTQPPQPKRK